MRYLRASTLSAVGFALREVGVGERVIGPVTWPANRPKLTLRSDVLPADLLSAVGLELVAEVFIGGVWRRWCSVATQAGSIATEPCFIIADAPPAGTSVRVRVIPAALIDAGVIVRGDS